MRYITIKRGDIEYKRRVLTKAEQRARLVKFRASMAKRNGRHTTTTTQAQAKQAKSPPPKGNGAVQGNGHNHDTADAARLKAQTEAALIHLRRGADWLRDNWGGHVRDLDCAHRELLNARAELMGK